MSWDRSAWTWSPRRSSAGLLAVLTEGRGRIAALGSRHAGIGRSGVAIKVRWARVQSPRRLLATGCISSILRLVRRRTAGAPMQSRWAASAHSAIGNMEPSSIRICEADRRVQLALELPFRPLHVPVAWMRLGDALHGPCANKMI